MMCLQLIETLVVERRHQLGINRLALRIEYRQCPLFLLTGFQAITEGGPLQFQFLVRQGPLDLGGMGIALAILHPGKGEQQTVFVVVLIDKLTVDQLVVSVNSPTLKHFLTSKDTIDDMHVGSRRAHLNGDRLAVGRKLGS